MMTEEEKRGTFVDLGCLGMIIIATIIGIVLILKVWNKHINVPPKEEQKVEVYQIDSTQCRVVYEDTWGKLLILKNEDL